MTVKLRGLAISFLCIVLVCASVPVYGQGVLDRIALIEAMVYGKDYSAKDLTPFQRVSKLESDLFGVSGGSTASLVPRVDKIWNMLAPSDEVAGNLSMTLNAVEWLTFNEVREHSSLVTQLEFMENAYYGKVLTGPFDGRIKGMLALFPDIQMQSVVVPAGTVVQLELMDGIDSTKNRDGDVIKFRINENVFVDDILVIPKGLLGTGVVKQVTQAKQLGRDAQVVLELGSVKAIDRSLVDLIPSAKVEKGQDSVGLAALIGTAGLVVLGSPIGAGLAFVVKGAEVVMPVGTVILGETVAELDINGIVFH